VKFLRWDRLSFRIATITEEVGYLHHTSRFRMLSGAGAAIRKLNEARLPVVVVTNNPASDADTFPNHW
jgi:hypothetical protein